MSHLTMIANTQAQPFSRRGEACLALSQDGANEGECAVLRTGEVDEPFPSVTASVPTRTTVLGNHTS
jgi:hypothetical protein